MAVRGMDAKTRLLDFLTMALPGILVLLATVILLMAGAQGPKGWPVGTAVVGFVFLGIWLRVRLLRQKKTD
jgi:hypothetical protein